MRDFYSSCISCSLSFLNQIIYIQENQFTGLHESNVDARLKAFRSAFTWKVVLYSSMATETSLEIRYCQVDLALCIHTHSPVRLVDHDRSVASALEVCNIKAST